MFCGVVIDTPLYACTKCLAMLYLHILFSNTNLDKKKMYVIVKDRDPSLEYPVKASTIFFTSLEYPVNASTIFFTLPPVVQLE